MKQVLKHAGVFLIGYLTIVCLGYLAFGVSPLDLLPRANGAEVANQTEKPDASAKKIVVKPRPMRTIAVVSEHVLCLENVTEKNGQTTTAIHLSDGSRIVTHKSIDSLMKFFEEEEFVTIIGRIGY